MSALRVALMVLALGCGSFANAASSMTVTISGTVLAPTCVINGGRFINAYFGDVQTADIDGSYKTIPIPYTLNCSSVESSVIRMQVRGTQSFTPALLAITGIPEVGIQFIKDGTNLAINTWSNFNRTSTPRLQVVLVKRAGSTQIRTGAFFSSATLMVEYL
ncbi:MULTISPECIES: fimbrial protein [Pseudomonas]|uniref:Fimbrial protein n=1 Tax=Pseudomonas weihenstephanensis TaxID=1608994 RepID=A0ABS1ZH32_9PSED|nr:MULTISPECIES: fimbrial protein [Pseudomonas]KVV06073.1 putative fimbrial subunit SteE [Pseudomonas sp. TAD18]KVV07686.1 putative fimbrial subunit SteE [Pseudomonas sp. TAA207]MBM1195770.1 fimbrial protein [Pseudomonas weihenstephanensis]